MSSAVAAGPVSNPRSWSAPTAGAASAAVTATSTSSAVPSTRTGTPRAEATASSKLANSSGRASPVRTSTTPRQVEHREHGGVAAQPEDGAEQHRDPGAAVAGRRRRRVQRQEQHAQTEQPGEHAADHHVVGAPARPEGAEQQGHEDGAGEEADVHVEPRGQRREGAGERRVAQRVAREDLRADHQEVADHAGRHRDGPTGQRGVPRELLAEEVADAGERCEREHHGASSCSGRWRPRCATAWTACTTT